MKTSRYEIPESIKKSSTEKLLDLWELTEYTNNPETPIVRGWLMDEIELRCPEGFEEWLDSECPNDKDLRGYILK